MRNILLLVLAILLVGCTEERSSQSKTAENVTVITDPIVLHTPFGDIVAEPVKYRMVREEVTVEHEKKKTDDPVTPVIQAVANTSGMGPLGIAGTILGLLTTAATGYTAMKRKSDAEAAKREADAAARQRDELVDGVERAKKRLVNIADESGKPAWEHLKTSLEAEQSRDTKAVVRERTA